MIVRMRYEANGGHVRVRVFTGPKPSSCGFSGSLTIRLDDWLAFRHMMEMAGCSVLPEGVQHD